MIYKILTILFLLILIITLFVWWQGKISKHLGNDIMDIMGGRTARPIQP